MSGVEAIGLFFAVYQLFFSSLTSYAGGLGPVLKPIQFMTKRERHKKSLIDFCGDLKFELALLKTHLKALTDQLSGSIELPDLTGSSVGDHNQWQDPQLIRGLYKILGDFAEPFAEDLRKVLGMLEKLVNDSTLHVPVQTLSEALDPSKMTFPKLEKLQAEIRSNRNTVKELLDRMKFGIKDDHRRELLKIIQKRNKKIGRTLAFCGVSISRHCLTGPLEQKPPGPKPTWDKTLQERVQALLKFLKSMPPCQNCNSPGETLLGLLNGLRNNTALDDPVFDLWMNFQPKPSPWVESKLRVETRKNLRDQAVQFLINGDSPSPELAPCERRLTGSTLRSNTLESPPQRNRVSDHKYTSKTNVSCLSCTLKKALETKICISLVFDDEGLSQLRNSFQSKPSPQREKRSLREMLEKSSKYTKPKDRLSLRFKKTMAVVLSQALLLFNFKLNKDQIHFFEGDDCQAYTDLDGLLKAKEQDSDHPVHGNAKVLSLAILLLELELENSIEAFYEPDFLDESGKPHVNTDFFTAMRVLESQSDYLSDSVREILSVCLTGNFDGDFEDELHALYEKVVQPLEQELNYAFGSKSADIDGQEMSTYRRQYRSSTF